MQKLTDIPRSHPRYASLVTRERITRGVKEGITSMQGLIAQGRGEAFDYLIGEKTSSAALSAIEAAAASLILASHPVLNVNGNVAALCPAEMASLANLLEAPLEVNLFHRTEERVGKIASLLRGKGARVVVGETPDERIPGLDHDRARTSRAGTFGADVVLVPLEDGDRTEALKKMGKKVITIDLNPFSRSAVMADITIVDNIIRCIPLLSEKVASLRTADTVVLQDMVRDYDNTAVLAEARQVISRHLADPSA
jgi:4-phosphopantoate---beta-alanine ligase